MGSELLEKVLKRKIPITAVVACLEGSSENGLEVSDCDIEEFIPCFINFLRDQAMRILSSEIHTLPVEELKQIQSGFARSTESRGFQSGGGYSKENVKDSSPDVFAHKQTYRRHKHGRKKSTGSSLGHNSDRSPVEKSCKPLQISQKWTAPVPFDKSCKINDTGFSAHASGAVMTEYEMSSLMQRFHRSFGDNSANITYDSSPSVISTSKRTGSEITADPNLVSHTNELHIMADIYCCLLNFNYVPNLMTELCFIICLLVVQPLASQENKGNESFEKINYLDTVHNCVYFASLMLNHQRHLLEHFDTVTLKMLADNSRLKKFMPELCSFISETVKNCEKQKISSANIVKYNENVSFLYERDNRANFPNDHAFHAFCKQRDGFYEILRIWEENHQSGDWSFGMVLAPKIRTLLTLHSDPGNYVHFARLFRSLLLTRCSRFNNPTEIHETNGYLCFSKHLDPGKLKCLHDRFVAPYNSRDHTLFPGHQEFFRDFIVHSSNPTFIQHLSDSFNSEILQLNDSSFLASDLEDTDLYVDESTKRSYVRTLSALCLLGKFAGFIAFLPYHSQSTVLSENIIAAQASVRDKVRPSLDILQCLINATENKRLILTLPWVLEFLSQMDNIASHVYYYRSVFEVLFKIYQKIQFNKTTSEDKKRKMSDKASLLIRLLLGWFFDSPNFPEELLFAQALKYRSSFFSSGEKTGACRLSDPSLDELDMVDEYCLYLCCPFMGQLKLCLMKDPGSLYRDTRSSEKRKVPVLASFHQPLKPSPTDELQMDLEEAFLHNQPVSTRRSIEYVADRVASCCVKYICNEVTYWAKNRVASRVEAELETIHMKEDLSSYHTLKVAMAKEFDELALIGCREFKERCVTELKSYCYSRCNKALPALMADNVKPEIVDACVHISGRLSWEKVGWWIDAHLSESDLSKDFKSEMCKTIRRHCNGKKIKKDTSSPEKNLHDKSTESVPCIVKKLKALVRRLLNGNQNEVSASEIDCILESVKQTLQKRMDVLPVASRMLPSLTVDLLLIMVMNYPELVHLSTINNFISLWNKPVPANLARLLCPRNILLLSQSSHAPETVWKSMSQLISVLLAKNILSPVAVEEQCIALLQRSWPQGILNLMSKCYRDVVENFNKGHPSETDKFSLMMSWLSEACSDMESYPDDHYYELPEVVNAIQDLQAF